MSERVALRINGGEPIPVDPGRKLLSVLHEHGIFPPSACGGRGLCGLCRVRVTEGAKNTPSDPEKKHISQEDFASGVRLSCQLVFSSDTAVELPESYSKARRYEVVVAAMETLSHDTSRLTLAFPEGERFTFAAGQYVRLEIPPYGDLTEPVVRAYSISSAPSETASVELIVRKIPNGLETTYIHEILHIGDRLRLDGPYGDFDLRRTPAEAVCIAGGSGIAPFESMLTDAAERGVKKKITFLLGAHFREDFYDLEKIRSLEGRLPEFRFIPVLSCPQPEDAWDGETGSLLDVVSRLFPNCNGKEAYLCGSRGMIDACVELLLKSGMKADDICFDKF